MLFANRPDFPTGLRVLLIDGEDGARQRIVEQLGQLSYSVAPCADAETACTAISAPDVSYDIILAEAACLESTTAAGQRLLAHAKASSLPLVIMSSSSGQEDVMKGIELGAVDFLEKPVSQLKLRNIWQHVVRKMMSADQTGHCCGKQELFHEKVASGSASPYAASPAMSQDHMQSAFTTHSSKCSETDASSYLEAKVETMGESTGMLVEASKLARCPSVSYSCDGSKASGMTMVPTPFTPAMAQPSPGAATPTGGLRASSGSRASKRAKTGASSGGRSGLRSAPSMPAIGAAAKPAGSFMRAPSMPAMGDSGSMASAAPGPGCVWGTPIAGQPLLSAPHYLGGPSLGQWQAPASVMVPTSATTLSEAAPSLLGPATPSGLDFQRMSLQSAASALASAPLPAMDAPLGLDFDVGSCNDLLDEADASFSASGDSTHSDFTELLLPDDLELDLMFGDSVVDTLPAPQVQRPPIGLALRKSESLVDLINQHLAAASSGVAGAC